MDSVCHSTRMQRKYVDFQLDAPEKQHVSGIAEHDCYRNLYPDQVHPHNGYMNFNKRCHENKNTKNVYCNLHF